MRIGHVFFAMLLLLQIGCQACHSPTQCIKKQSVTSFSKTSYSPKNPQQISFYDNKNEPKTGYRIIGSASVSRYDLFGTERQEATVREMMKTLAASIGGDGLINLNQERDEVKGHIIAYQPVIF